MTKVLVIDDDPGMRRIVRHILELIGYEVKEAPDGKIGEKIYKEEGADLIIMDVVMPEQEGLQTIQALKKNNSDVKIIAISGEGKMGPDEYLAMASKMGALFTLAKPFGSKELREVVQKALDS